MLPRRENKFYISLLLAHTVSQLLYKNSEFQVWETAVLLSRVCSSLWFLTCSLVSRLALTLAFQVLLGVKGEAPYLCAHNTTGEMDTLNWDILQFYTLWRVRCRVSLLTAQQVKPARLIETFYFPWKVRRSVSLFTAQQVKWARLIETFYRRLGALSQYSLHDRGSGYA